MTYDYAATLAAGFERIAATADAVAAELGDGWARDTSTDAGDDGPRYWGQTVTGPAGENLFLRPDGERLAISASYGVHREHVPYGVAAGHQVTVGYGRTAKAIAGEITRRLLPDYRADLVKVQARFAADTDNAAARARVAAALVDLLPGASLRPDNGAAASLADINFYSPGTNGRATVNYAADAVNLHLDRLPVDVALRIAGIVAEGGAVVKIHTDKLWENDLHSAITTAGLSGVYLEVMQQGSRTHARGFTVRLRTDRDTGRYANSGRYGADTSERAATYDEHGAWMAVLFDLDSGATIPSAGYAGRDNFHEVTGGKYRRHAPSMAAQR